MTKCVVGVDPGGKGAFALYRPGFAPASDGLLVWDMPVKQVQVSRNKFKEVVDLHGIYHLAAFLVDIIGAERVIIEKVGGMPGQGSGFTFGWNCGTVHMAFIAAGLEPEMVMPARWKKDSQVPADKKAALKCADLTFPEHKAKFRVPHKTQKAATVPRPDRAEAALIAHWGAHFT